MTNRPHRYRHRHDGHHSASIRPVRHRPPLGTDRWAVVLSQPTDADRPPAVPSNVADAVCKRWPDRGPQWLNNVHNELATLCERYGAEPVQVMRARYGFVVEVNTSSGLLVLRSSPDPNGPNQTKVSLALAELGIGPRIHEVVTSPVGTWTVADRVLPGTPIAEIADQTDPTAVVAMLRPMVGQPAPADLPSLADWLRDRLTDPQPRDLPVGRGPAPAPERRQALAVLDDLAPDTPAALCHADVSSWNILLTGDLLCLVDPRGVAGEVAYDVGVVALKAARYGRPSVGTDRLARQVGVDPERARAWAIVALAARV